MHVIIRTIVYGKDENEALKEAKTIFRRFVENRVFDYYTLFNDKDARVSGIARWGRLEACPLAESKKGKEGISQAMRSTKDWFLFHLNQVKDFLQTCSDDELFDEGKDGWFRYRCRCLGEYIGPNIYLYDSDGEGVLNEKRLKCALRKRPNKEAYVVPADVHY